MKKFRRSNKSADIKQSQLRVFSKDASAVEPPKKVVVASFNYQPAPGEEPPYLSFKTGDYFHVVARENDTDWYEVIDAKGRKGLVPVNHCADVGKLDLRNKQGKELHDSGYSEGQGNDASRQSPAKSAGKAGTMVYGVVMYDFQAERPDELQAAAGETIIIIAQSNPEWFVAKPIMRLGGPGLIPSAFVELRDSSTNQPVEDQAEAIRVAGIPRVEEWKQRAAWYKDNSVPLGKLSGGQSLQQAAERMSISNATARRTSGAPVNQDPFAQHRMSQDHRNTLRAQPQTRLVCPSYARIAGYTQDQDSGDFQYRVEVVNEDGRAWALHRSYKEFYDLQVHLMEQFPDAAGKNPPVPRTLPYLPGPLPEATAELTERRIPHMHDYIHKILHMHQAIVESHPTRLFFSPREIDEEIAPFDASEIHRMSALSQTSFSEPHQSANASRSGSVSTNQQQGYDQRRVQSPPGLRPVNGLHERAPPPMLRNNSAFTTASAASNGSQNAGQMGAVVKIKVFLGENCILLRLPASFTYADLVAKVRERWRLEPDALKNDSADVELDIEYKDDPTQEYYPIGDDEELRIARDRNDKLTLKVRARNGRR